jgi:dienelactone hydrolase
VKHPVVFVATSYSVVLLLAAMSCRAGIGPAPRIVDLTAADGIRLKASYFAAGKPGPGVLLLHQCDHDRKIWVGLAQQLATAGINVLTMDLRGFGDSGDTPHTGKTGPLEPPEEMQKWPADIDVAFQYLKSQPDVKAGLIGLGGASCGVSNAIKTAIRHPEVKSLVLLAGPADAKDRMFLRQTKIPVFFAVSDDDPYTSMIPFTEWLYLATASPEKKFAHYKTGGHGAEIFAVHPDLLSAITDWYVGSLMRTPAQLPTNDSPAICAEAKTWDLLEQAGGPAELAKSLSAARQKDPKASLVTAQMIAESTEKDPKALEARMQQMIDSAADEQFDAGGVRQSLEIAKLDALAYPNSPLAYALVAQAYASEGQADLARQNAHKALELLPSDKVYEPKVHDGIKEALEDILKPSNAVQ